MISTVFRSLRTVWQHIQNYGFEVFWNFPLNAIEYLTRDYGGCSQYSTCRRSQLYNRDTSIDEFCIHIITWNVDSKFPPPFDRVYNLLNIDKNSKKLEDSHPDFFAIGLQEVGSNMQKIAGSTGNDEAWCSRFVESLERYNYVLVKSKHMFSITILFFAKRKHLLRLRDIEAEQTRTGMGGLLGNKGTVSIRVSIYGCQVCLVNSHFAADESALDERVSDYENTVHNHRYKISRFNDILSHDIVFWFGDLNFRLKTDKYRAEDINRLIEENERDKLLAMDELKITMDDGRVFQEFVEKFPKFPPTFKFENESPYYNLKRRPAWTDRVLHKIHPKPYSDKTFEVGQVLYESYPECDVSDHRPVAGEYRVKFIDIPSQPSSRSSHEQRDQPIDATTMLRTFVDNTQSYVEFRHISEWIAEEDNIIEYTLPESFVERPASDWIGLFRHNFSDLSRYVAYQYVPSRSNLMNDGATVNERRRQITMNFAETSSSIVDDAWYVLLYFEREEGGATGVAGISNPFRAKRLVQPAEKKPGPNIPQSTNVHQS